MAKSKLTKEDKISALEQLKDNIGWKIIVKALKNDVKSAEARLHGDTKLEEGETIKEWQKIRKGVLEMISLPDRLIEENKNRDEFDPNLDPYE